MSQSQLVDHLFRHQHGKMVSILTRIFGFQHLDTIEDAVQDTFISALGAWTNGIPDNPEAWLTKAAKNRTLDLFRKLQADQHRVPKLDSGPSSMALNELFLASEIADSQLRMIFAACTPSLHPKDQIAFALKTISGFSQKEIAASLLLKEETVKKRLSRARKVILETNVNFEIPSGHELPERLNRVLEVLYLLFNEGFHSTQQDFLIREELCGEAMRLCKMLLANEYTQRSAVHALFALMCFNIARLESKTNTENEIISLRNQDRTKWLQPLIHLGHTHMNAAVKSSQFSSYHYEAAIAAEHSTAPKYEETNWENILHWYEQLESIQPSPFNALNRAVIYLQLRNFDKSEKILIDIDPSELEHRAYLYYGLWAEFYYKKGNRILSIEAIDKALKLVSNSSEKTYLLKKKALYNLPEKPR